MNFRKIYNECKPPMSFEEINFECNVRPLFEQILRESPTGVATGGQIGYQAGKISLNQEKPIVELLKLATSKATNNTKIIPEKYITVKKATEKGFIKTVVQTSQEKLIKISDIPEQDKRNAALIEWASEATESFIKTISSKRVINKQERQEIHNYFNDLANEQPQKGRQNWI